MTDFHDTIYKLWLEFCDKIELLHTRDVQAASVDQNKISGRLARQNSVATPRGYMLLGV